MLNCHLPIQITSFRKEIQFSVSNMSSEYSLITILHLHYWKLENKTFRQRNKNLKVIAKIGESTFNKTVAAMYR